MKDRIEFTDRQLTWFALKLNEAILELDEKIKAEHRLIFKEWMLTKMNYLNELESQVVRCERGKK
jgi:hypothetical protein